CRRVSRLAGSGRAEPGWRKPIRYTFGACCASAVRRAAKMVSARVSMSLMMLGCMRESSRRHVRPTEEQKRCSPRVDPGEIGLLAREEHSEGAHPHGG